MSEISACGPVAAVIDAELIVDHKGGIFTDTSFSQESNHIWIVCDSWGEHWGEMGFMRLEIGQNLLGVESEVAWVTPDTFSVENYPCAEDGKNCNGDGFVSQKHVDPSNEIEVLERRLRGRK